MTALHVHRFLVRLLLPRWFRERHGEAMEETFARALEEARAKGGRGGLRRLWVREVRDLVRAGVGLRARRRRIVDVGEMTRRRGGDAMMGARGAWDDVRFAVRGLARKPAFTLFAAGTLALGVGSSTAVFSALEGVVLNPLPFPDADRVVTVWRSSAGGRGFIAPRPEQVEVWQEMEDVFEELRVYHGGSATLTGLGEPVQVRHFRAGEGLFEFMGAAPTLGRTFTERERAGEGAPVIVVSEGLWQRRLGGRRDVLGATLTLDGEPRTVVGVVPNLPNPMTVTNAVDVWAPLGAGAGATTVSSIGRLREGVTIEDANARLDALADGASEASLGTPADWRARATLLADFGRAGITSTLRLLMGAVVLLLLIACVNVANLLLHRAIRMRRETAVRAALGATRGRLVRHGLLESLILGLGGGVLGAGLAWAGLRVVERVRPEQMRLLDGLGLNPRVLLFAVVISLGAGLLFGALPAFRLLGRDQARGIHRGSRGGTAGPEGSRLRWGLVAAEVGLSFALVLGAAVVVNHLRDIQSRDPGFRTEGLLSVTVTLPSWRYEEEPDRAAAFDRILAEVRRLPGVEGAVLTTGIPPDLGVLFGRLQPEGAPAEDETAFVRSSSFGPGILSILGQPLLAGRDLRPEDAEDGTQPVVVGRTLADHLFPGAEPAAVVGRRFRTSPGGDFHTVVGVAEDVRTNGLASDLEELLAYFPRTSTYGSMRVAVRIDTDAIAPGLSTFRSLVRQVEPDAFVEMERADDMMADTVGRERFTTVLLSAFAAVALLLSAVGLYGVLSQAVGERTREIGIRMSLGADAGKVRRMVLRGGAGAVVTGLLGGAALAVLGSRLAASQVADLTGLDQVTWSSWIVAAAVLSAVALLAVWVPARRATLIDPSEAIRSE